MTPSMRLAQARTPIGENGETLLITEADWNYSFRFSDAEERIKPILDDPTCSELFKFFCRSYYSLLASCVIEGELPSPQQAFEMPREYLDNWYLTFWKLNPEIIQTPFRDTPEVEMVTFRDGSTLQIGQVEGLPSSTLKLVELENEAIANPLENPQGQMFASLFYPKMVASCVGDENIPDAMDVLGWPRSEIERWLNPARRLNPGWFLVREEEKVEQEKKNKKKARRRSGG